MPDNYSQWEWQDIQRERMLARRPRCVHCGEPIQDEKAWRINGELWCESCAEAEFTVWTEDYET